MINNLPVILEFHVIPVEIGVVKEGTRYFLQASLKLRLDTTLRWDCLR